MNRAKDKEETIKRLAELLINPLFVGAKTEVVFSRERYLVSVSTLSGTSPEEFEVIWALEHLLRSLAEKALGEWNPIDVDIDKSRQRREENLKRLALEAGERAMKRGRPVYLKPMTAWERRIIHLTLQDSPNVMTESVGAEPYRRVVVKRK